MLASTSKPATPVKRVLVHADKDSSKKLKAKPTLSEMFGKIVKKDEVDNTVAPQTATVVDDNSKKPCYSFQKSGTCEKGDRCKFSHGVLIGTPAKTSTERPSGSVKSVAPNKICYAFQKTGSCDKGDACKFSHDALTVSGNISISINNNQAAQPVASATSNTTVLKPAANKNACHAFEKTGTCSKGSACRFSHEGVFAVDVSQIERQLTAPAAKSNAKTTPHSNKVYNDAASTFVASAPSAAAASGPAAVVRRDVAPTASGISNSTGLLFSSLNICPASKRALAEVLQYQHMTPIQEAVLPHILNKADVLAKAKTGTGKTLAFLIPVVEALNSTVSSSSTIDVLILAPARELAIQIAKEGEELLTFSDKKIYCIYGGTNINSEKKQLAGKVHILVATPGTSEVRRECTCYDHYI